MWIINKETNTAVNSFAITSVYAKDREIVAALTDGKTEVLATYGSEESADKALDRFIKSPGGFIRRTVSFPTEEELNEEPETIPDIITDEDDTYPWEETEE